MDFITKPPQWLSSNLPEGGRSFLDNGGWLGILAIGGIIILLLLGMAVSKILRGMSGGPRKAVKKNELEEDLEAIPAPPALTGDRRLVVEGVPVRLRLVVVAPAGRGYDINAEAVNQILDRVVSGLGKIAVDDKPRVKIWPFQLSYEGFANTFHRNTPLPEGEEEPSRWVMVAGRAHLGKNQVLVGLGLQAVKPTTVGRLRLEQHEWSTTLRIRTRE